MTATVPDVDLLDALDWQHEPPCEAKTCKTPDQPARWRVHGALPCGHGADQLICHSCAVELRRYLQEVADDWRCYVCHRHYPGSPLSHFRFEALS